MKAPHKILVIDDELSICKGCQRIFEEEGHSIKFALSGREGLEQVDTEVFDVAIIDLKMPDIDGLEVMRSIKEKQPSLAMIMITGYASVPTAVEAIKVGAEDFIPKPFTPDEILTVVNKVLERLPQQPGEEEAPQPAAVFAPELEPAAPEETPEVFIDADQVMSVLNRAVADGGYFAAFLDHGLRAQIPGASGLGHEAAAAITSGDIRWFEEHAGRLTPEQKQFLMRRLCIEAW